MPLSQALAGKMLERHAAQLARENDEHARRLHQLIEEVEIVAGHLAFSQPQTSSLWSLWWRRARDRRRFDDWLDSLVERLLTAIEEAKPRYDIDGAWLASDARAPRPEPLPAPKPPGERSVVLAKKRRR